jgi:hypothetical protein
LLQKSILKSNLSKLSFNIENVDDLFPGFMFGDFAVLHGSTTLRFLSSLLCVRAQLPPQLGGLGTNVVFVDGGNTFRLYEVSTLAQLHQLDPRKVLGKIFISRAFTAYQMTSLLLDRLENAIDQYDAKFAIISDIAQLYLDKDVPKRESKEIFNQVTTNLSRFAEKNQVILVTTFLPNRAARRRLFFKTAVCGRGRVVASIRTSRYGQRFELEKHPYFRLGSVDLPSKNQILSKIVGA